MQQQQEHQNSQMNHNRNRNDMYQFVGKSVFFITEFVLHLAVIAQLLLDLMYIFGMVGNTYSCGENSFISSKFFSNLRIILYATKIVPHALVAFSNTIMKLFTISFFDFMTREFVLIGCALAEFVMFVLTLRGLFSTTWSSCEKGSFWSLMFLLSEETVALIIAISGIIIFTTIFIVDTKKRAGKFVW